MLQDIILGMAVPRDAGVGHGRCLSYYERHFRYMQINERERRWAGEKDVYKRQNVDVVVNASSLTDAQRAQIELSLIHI